jgi:hypothetical protein
MKIEALHDADGVIVAAIGFEDDESPRPHPVAADGQSVGVFDIPEEHSDTPLDILCTTLRADIRRGSLVERQVGESS